MRYILTIVLLFVVTTFASESTGFDVNSGDNSIATTQIPNDDEDYAEGSSSGEGYTEDEIEGYNEPSNEDKTSLYYVEPIPEEEEEGTEIPIDPEMYETATSVSDLPKIKKTEEKDFDIDQSEPKVQKTAGVFESTHFITAIIIGASIGLLFAIVLILLLVYRMRKKDEGSYALDEKKKNGAPPAYQYTQGQEYYA